MKQFFIDIWQLIRPRLKSKVVWVCLCAAVVAILGDDFLVKIFGRDSTSINNIVDTISTCLVAFGILNNPTDKENF